MGCLRANVELLTSRIDVSLEKIGGITGTCRLLTKPLVILIRGATNGLKVSLGIVCTPKVDNYIRVKPTILWFSKSSETLDVEVSSNVKWIVK